MAIKIKLLDGSESSVDPDSIAPSEALRDLIQNTLETEHTAYLVEKALLLERMSRVLAKKGLDWDERERYERDFNSLADELTESTSFSYMGREGLVDVNPPDYSAEARRARAQLMRNGELNSEDFRRMSSEIGRNQELSGRYPRNREDSPAVRRDRDSSIGRSENADFRSRRRNDDGPEGPDF